MDWDAAMEKVEKIEEEKRNEELLEITNKEREKAE